MKKKLEYYVDEETKNRCLKDEEAPAIDIDNLAPFLPFDNSEFYVRIKREHLKIREEYYFDVEFNEGDGYRTVIISDGAKYLPPILADIVNANDYFCVCVRMLNENNDADEEVSIIIFYGNEGRLLFADMVHPAGRNSEIWLTIGTSYSSYLVSYNHHSITINNDDTFQCECKTSTKKLGLIEYVDDRGINYLSQYLDYRSKYIAKTIQGSVRKGSSSGAFDD
ncbi:MAG: hypothetical protein MJ154_03115 [Candidatus Saccharibacteria bacterium]|nr:hypothetical protein [Candidatus Saccharibacteria bacterium]